MIDFYQYSHHEVQIEIDEQMETHFATVVDIQEFEDALDILLDGYLLDDWLKETMKGKAERCCDRGVISDEQLESFLAVLEEII